MEETNGPWKMVQKQKRGKKVVEGRRNIPPMKVNEKNGNGGSRFLALEINYHELNGDDDIINGDKVGEADSMGKDFMARGDNYGNSSDTMINMHETDDKHDLENIRFNMATHEDGFKETSTRSWQ